MKKQYTCPDHGPIDGLGVCWEETPDGPCHYDARTEVLPEPQALAPLPTSDQPAPVDAEFTVPWSFLVSKNAKRGGMVGRNTKEYRAALEAMTTLFTAKYNGGPHTEPVRVCMELYPPDRRSDGQNYTEAIFDALEHAGVLSNDRLIRRWEGTVEYVDKDDPRCYVTVQRWDP